MLWRLSEIYLFQTFPKASYRAVCLDKFNFNHFISILSGTQFIDSSYLKHSIIRNRAVIRFSEKDGTKNKLIDIIPGYAVGRNRSPDHAVFLSSLYPDVKPIFPIPKPIKLRLSKYESFR